jgi:hypothetical protein
MHGTHDHRPPHRHDGAHARETPSGYALRPAAGDNRPAPVQWQSRHSPPAGVEELEPDFDLVENAFAESFPTAPDPTSFLRLAGIPFVGRSAGGGLLHLLRVEYEQMTDVATATPHLGGGSMRIDPLPASMVSRRRRLRFVYQGDPGIVSLSLAEARALLPISTGVGSQA